MDHPLKLRFVLVDGLLQLGVFLAAKEADRIQMRQVFLCFGQIAQRLRLRLFLSTPQIARFIPPVRFPP